MKRNKTAAGVWLTGAALVLALFCPLPVLAAARVTAAIPATVRTEGADSAAICTVELTPLDNAPAPAQCRLTVKNGGTAYFTGLGFDAPGDYRYRVAELKGSAANTSYDAGVYTVTVRVTSKPSLVSWLMTAAAAPSKLASWWTAEASNRPSTSVIVLSEDLSETLRMSSRGADSTLASSTASAGEAARATVPVTVIPASPRRVTKVWAASMAGSAG